MILIQSSNWVAEDLPFEKPVDEPEVPQVAAHQFEGLVPFAQCVFEPLILS